MIYTMNTKTFLKIFSKEDPKIIEKTQFVIISDKIRKSSEDDNVVFCRSLFPTSMMLADARNTNDSSFFRNAYMDMLHDNCRLVLATIIMGVLEENYTVVFLCTLNEWKLKFMGYLSEYIESEFGYPIIDYKKFKLKGYDAIPTLEDFDIQKIKEKCQKVIDKATKKQLKKKMRTAEGRREILDNMSKGEMKKQLKKMNLYTGSNMSKHMMKSLLKEFFVDE